MIPFATTTVLENPLSSSNNNISMSWSYNSSLDYSNFLLTGSLYGAPISGTISQFLNIPYRQSKDIKWISFPSILPSPNPLFTLSPNLGFYNKLTDLSLDKLENSKFSCTSNVYLTNLTVRYCDNLKQIDLSNNPSLNSCIIVECDKLNNYITTSISGNYDLFNTEKYIGSVSQSYLSGSCITSSIYVSGSSKFNSNKYSGYVSGTYGSNIPITSNLTNYNGPITGSISGSISGSFTGSFLFSSGSLIDFTGSLNGNLNGNQYTYTPAINLNKCPNLYYFFADYCENVSKIDVSNNTNLRIFYTWICSSLTDIIGIDKIIDLYSFEIYQSMKINWSLINFSISPFTTLDQLWIRKTNIQSLDISNMIYLNYIFMSENFSLTEVSSSAGYYNLNYIDFAGAHLSLNSVNSLYTNLSSSMKYNSNYGARLNGYLNLNGSPLPTTQAAIDAKSFIWNTMSWSLAHVP
jgi:hypothetical protein